jgi:hypothetical protein
MAISGPGTGLVVEEAELGRRDMVEWQDKLQNELSFKLKFRRR